LPRDGSKAFGILSEDEEYRRRICSAVANEVRHRFSFPSAYSPPNAAGHPKAPPPLRSDGAVQMVVVPNQAATLARHDGSDIREMAKKSWRPRRPPAFEKAGISGVFDYGETSLK
jgi:hypothetical protein